MSQFGMILGGFDWASQKGIVSQVDQTYPAPEHNILDALKSLAKRSDLSLAKSTIIAGSSVCLDMPCARLPEFQSLSPWAQVVHNIYSAHEPDKHVDLRKALKMFMADANDFQSHSDKLRDFPQIYKALTYGQSNVNVSFNNPSVLVVFGEASMPVILNSYGQPSMAVVKYGQVGSSIYSA